MYVTGGAESWNCLNTVERYNPENNTWTLVAPMNVARRGAGVAVHAGEAATVDSFIVRKVRGHLSRLWFILISLLLSRQTVRCWRLRRLPRAPLRGGVRSRPQRVEDAG